MCKNLSSLEMALNLKLNLRIRCFIDLDLINQDVLLNNNISNSISI